MIQKIVLLILIFTLSIIGISKYLQPDDLQRCGDSPDKRINCTTVDAVVAVSGGDTAARVEEAVRLYKKGWSNKLIFSGAAKDKTGPSNATVMKEMAIAAGVPALSVWLDEYSENTKENAQNTKTIFDQFQIKSAILVTSGYHQRRSSLEFTRRITGVKILNHPVASDNDWDSFWFMRPRGWWLAIGEIVKISVFYVTGWF